VHINSGIPNRAFFLVATNVGEFSWDVAGRIWYDVITDPDLRDFAADGDNWHYNCFPFFALLTVQHAAKYAKHCGNANVVEVVTQAWQAVGINPVNPCEERKSSFKDRFDCVVS
jgi:Zn-dependent metalloprotease